MAQPSVEPATDLAVRDVPGGDTPAIEVHRLTKRFDTFTAVDDLSFTVPRRSIYGFLGPNGAGKTTTLGMLLGLIPKDRGSAKILGFDIDRQLPEALGHTGALIERPAFYPYLSGRQNLRLLGRIAGVDDPAVIEDVLQTVNLTNRADAKFNGYSTGMRQRLGIAMALLRRPELLVLDEPTSGLDPAGQREIRALVKELAAAGHTIIFSSHQLNEVQEVCTDLAIIDRGRLVASGPLDEILATGERVEIAVDRPDEASHLVETLPEVEEVEVFDRRLFVDVPVARAAALNRALVEAGFEVSELRRVETALEERFLALTANNELEVEGAPDDTA